MERVSNTTPMFLADFEARMFLAERGQWAMTNHQSQEVRLDVVKL